MPKIGAHVSSAGSLAQSLERAKGIGAEVTQIFISAPQRWEIIARSKEEIKSYKETAIKTGITDNFIHATYLINLASINLEFVQKSINWLIASQNLAKQLDMVGTIVHVGSCGNREEDVCFDQVINSIKQILKSTADQFLILENSAGAGRVIGNKLSELGEIIKRVGDQRIKVCLDTQHLFASGYDVKTPQGLEETLTEFDQLIGLGRLVAIHANDSKVESGSNRDRHENIGQGFIGQDGFKNIINYPKLQNIPFILEVPGLEKKGPGQDDIQMLKELADRL